MRRVPLRNRANGVRAFALVDDEDYDRVMAQGKWSIAGHGYVENRSMVRGRPVMTKLHRFVLGLKKGDPDIDHVDRNKLNCQKRNLRPATKALNQQNRDPQGNSNNTSGHRGVTWSEPHQKWKGQVMVDRRNHHVGYFESADDAAEAVAKFRAEHMPYAERNI